MIRTLATLSLLLSIQSSCWSGVMSALVQRFPTGTNVFSKDFEPGTGLSGSESFDLFAGLSSASTFGGFSYDPNTGLASYLIPNGSGGTQVATQGFSPGAGFSGTVEFDHFSSGLAPDAFGGFSFTDGIASWLGPNGSGGTDVFTQSFTPGSGFSGAVIVDTFSTSAPDVYGGFSYDPNTGLASILVPSGSNTLIMTLAFSPGAGFSPGPVYDAFSSSHAGIYGGFSHLSVDAPSVHAVPEPGTWGLMLGSMVLGLTRRKSRRG